MREWRACWWVLGALVVSGCGTGGTTVASGGSGASAASSAATSDSSASSAPEPSTVAPSPVAPSAEQDCPERFASDAEQPWVPAVPTTETPGRLVPDADPVEALVCRYAPLAEGPSQLVGGRLLAGRLTAVRRDLALPERLSGQERACTEIDGPQVPHLLRLRYADGELWLSAVQEPNECTDTGNGAFVTSTYLGERFAAAYDSGAWPSAPVTDPSTCPFEGFGPAGREVSLVPDGWEALRVCGPDGPREVDPMAAARVADLLSRVESGPDSNACAGTARTTYELLLTWPEGPPVTADFSPGCVPEIRNGSLDGRPTAEQTEELTALLGG